MCKQIVPNGERKTGEVKREGEDCWSSVPSGGWRLQLTWWPHFRTAHL